LDTVKTPTVKIKDNLPNYNIENKINNKIEKLNQQVKQIMWENVGIIRDPDKLTTALAKLQQIKQGVDKIFNKGINRSVIELRNSVIVGLVITKAALERKTSACAHYINKDKN